METYTELLRRMKNAIDESPIAELKAEEIKKIKANPNYTINRCMSIEFYMANHKGLVHRFTFPCMRLKTKIKN